MRIEMLAAKHGDCFIIHGEGDDPALLLVDGGPSGTWRSALEPRLKELRVERSLCADQPLSIDLLIISHVDDDHINGVVALLEAMLQRRKDRDPPIYRIRRIWHNSFDNVLGNDETVARLKAAKSQFGPASVASKVDKELDAAPDTSARDVALMLASIEQGENVRRLAKALDIPINPDFGGGLITTQAGEVQAVKVKELRLTIAGPRRDEVAALQKAHDDWLKKHPERQADADSVLSALDDTSVANLSSLVILVESGARNLLLTGDACGDKILGGLEDCGALDMGGVLRLDVLKMPHHGSVRNIDEETMRRLPADTYLFAANGKYSNPDRATFEMLFKARPGARMRLILSYDLKEIEDARRRDHDRKWDVGDPVWDPAVHGLTALLVPPPREVQVVESTASKIEVLP